MNPKKLWWRWRGIAMTTPTITLLVVLLRGVGLLQPLEWRTYDQYLQWRPEETDSRIAIVGIDEEDIRQLEQAILPDAVYAEVISKLAQQEPRAIGLDIIRDIPVEPGHAQLESVYRNTPNLVGIRTVLGDSADRDLIDAAPTLADLGQVGINDGIVDNDNTIRRGLLMVTTPEGDQAPSLALYLALLYLDAEGIGPEPVGDQDFWQLNGTVFRPLETNDGGYVRADTRGYQTLINYLGGSEVIETVPLRAVLNDELPDNWATDRVILIGAVAESLKDRFFVPHSSKLLSLPKTMAGVEIHANLTSQIISAALDGRALIRTWPEAVEILWIFLWALLGATITWLQRNPGKRTLIRQMALLVAIASILVLGAYALLLAGWWVPVMPPLMALVGAAAGVNTYLAHSASQIRRTFSRYLSDQIVADLLENPDKLRLGGATRKITILTSDLRGFTALSEQLPPEQVVKILNLYLGYMSDVINEYQGVIDEFMGDGILVIFGAPKIKDNDNHATRAVACAIAMQQAMGQVNAAMRANGFPEQEMGIGINTGRVVVGNIGSEKRTKYSVIGGAVNLAFRIESYTTGGQIFISEDTHQEIGTINNHRLAIQSKIDVYPKGIKRPITIYDVVGIGGDLYNLSLTHEDLPLEPLTKTIPVEYVALEGKQVGAEHRTGSLQKLSAKTALLHIEETDRLNLLTNIKLVIQATSAPEEVRETDIYAKVQQQATEQDYLITFTARSPAIITWLNQQI
ncbi:adenylate/guanylate cyclase domain-containing protein [Leptolyngbya cf. ectocarpi LEGE 11479]|uniref:Adenylate/guanylate cyclase domain-containing protein n=1 Tax=Leptolyngbya cf. ectocarpi LEGE 11479 TaxID=1828722 RepID=A0A928ZVB9_LEPEC|nr:adenylate/guanylate cyclase domain-containing protein [Leptolyngbya ectocarpi]MBE9068143.1 adenylate/guanylate cyclase domain-containing protein [Leptolyngbya cf. ectocarpi LEGE 11479]